MSIIPLIAGVRRIWASRKPTCRDIPIDTLNIAQAEAYYLEHYWKQLYSQIQNQDVANKLFDMGFLFGVGTVTIFLQTCLKVEPTDGVFGPDTLQATNEADPASLLVAFKSVLMTQQKISVRKIPLNASL